MHVALIGSASLPLSIELPAELEGSCSRMPVKILETSNPLIPQSSPTCNESLIGCLENFSMRQVIHHNQDTYLLARAQCNDRRGDSLLIQACCNQTTNSLTVDIRNFDDKGKEAHRYKGAFNINQKISDLWLCTCAASTPFSAFCVILKGPVPGAIYALAFYRSNRNLYITRQFKRNELKELLLSNSALYPLASELIKVEKVS